MAVTEVVHEATTTTATTTTEIGTCPNRYHFQLIRQNDEETNNKIKNTYDDKQEVDDDKNQGCDDDNNDNINYHHHQLQHQHLIEDNKYQKCLQDHHHLHHHHLHQKHWINSLPHGFKINLSSSRIIHHMMFMFCLWILLVSKVECQAAFQVQPEDRSVPEGYTVVLNCTVVNRGAGLVQWAQGSYGLGGDRALVPYPRYSVIGQEHGNTGEYNLQIQDVQLSDEEEYTCQVSATDTSAGIMSKKAKLTVIVFPKRHFIVTENKDFVPVVLHRPTEIYCKANGGKPAPTITWHIDGQRVTRGVTVQNTLDGKLINSTSILTFNATMEDAAKRVECQAISQFMNRPLRTDATLDVQYAPNISMTYNVTSRNIRQGDYVRFQCAGMANPSQVTWRWFHDDDIIEGATTNIFHLKRAEPKHNNDVISCVATNSIGSTRVNQKLIVEYGPIIHKITQWVGADINRPAELECLVDGNPAPSITWRRKVQGAFSHSTLSTRSVYRIEKVNSQSFGWYICTATVIGFPDTSKEAMIIPNDIPKARSDKIQEAKSGEEGRVRCEVTSIPRPDSITWFKDGKKIVINLSGRFQTRQETYLYTVTEDLIIKKVKSSDFGYYNCSVTNRYGTAIDQIKLIEKESLPTTYIIIGIVLSLVVIFVIILVCVLYRRHFRKDDIGSVLDTVDTATTKTGSYTDTDSSSDKKRDKNDSPSTLMGQLRQGYTKDQYRFSADYDDMPYKEHMNGNNNGYRYIDPNDTFSDQNIYDGEYIGHNDRIVPMYSSTGGGYSLSSFRGNNYDHNTPPPTMTRLTPLHMNNSKLATDV